MRILNVTAQKPDSTGSGIYLSETVNAMVNLGHECAVICGITNEDCVRMPPSVRCFPVYYGTPALPFPVCGMSDEMPYESTRYSEMSPEMEEQFKAAFSNALNEAFSEFRPDIIVCHHLYLLTSFVRAVCPEIPVTGICHGSDLRQYASNELFREEIRGGIAKLDRICCLHRNQKDRICALFGVPEEKVHVIGTGFSREIFRDMSVRAPGGSHNLLFAGKISESKGVFSLLKSLELLPDDYTLSLAGGFGSREQEENFRTASARLGSRVRLLGKLSQEELAKEYSSHGIFVLPSFYEGLPLVLAEALACGMKAVCTDLPGIKDWMDESVPGNGIVFVKPPDFIRDDIPASESLPQFERRLADAVIKADSLPYPSADTKALSWEGVAAKILK